jgi:catechol 2,3-dioxygenase-like lactoylglutathione lyase family enzyme
MAKLRHIALAAEDPYATAEFYKKAFDFIEVRRTEPRGEGSSYGVFLSDGTISLAILRFGWDQGHGLDYRGIHHFGVLVDDVDPYVEKQAPARREVFLRDQVPRTRPGGLRHHRPSLARRRSPRRRHRRGCEPAACGEGGAVKPKKGRPQAPLEGPSRPRCWEETHAE